MNSTYTVRVDDEIWITDGLDCVDKDWRTEYQGQFTSRGLALIEFWKKIDSLKRFPPMYSAKVSLEEGGKILKSKVIKPE